MIKSDLAKRVLAKSSLPFERDARNVVDAILAVIEDALVNGDRVEIRGFGVFKTKISDQRIGRNPKTGEEIFLPEKRHVRFLPSKLFINRINMCKE